MAYVELELGVPLEQSFFGAHTDGHTQHLPCCGQVEPSDFKLSGHNPEFGECELFMGDKFEGGLVYLPCATVIL